MSIIHFKKNKAEEFEALVAPLEDKIFHICLGMMHHKQDAEDCAQEALLKAFRSFDSFRGNSSFSTWIYRICVNTCLDELRRRKSVVSLDDIVEKGYDCESPFDQPWNALESSERKRILADGIKLLPEDMQTVLIMRDIENMSIEETADILNLPPGTVKSRLTRAREKLMSILNKNSELFKQNIVKKSERRAGK